MSIPFPAAASPHLTFALIAASVVVGIAGVDLVLPAVPTLPDALGGTPAQAQYVLAAYAVGTGLGLLVFGELGARISQAKLLVTSLSLFAALSVVAALATTIEQLIAVRLAQGVFSAAPAVAAPGLVRGLFGEERAVEALGRLGSIESLTPALAPIAGAYLLEVAGWTASFLVLALVSIATAAATQLGAVPALRSPRQTERGAGYVRLLRDPLFSRYAVSHAFSLGSLLIFVFGLPAVLTGPLGYALSWFVVIQVVGIAFFIVGANLSGPASKRWGSERTILWGTALLAAALSSILLYALSGGQEAPVILLGSIFLNLGFGLRGPTGFHMAVVAARGDDSRGAALVVLGILGTAALGTAAAAPFVTVGLVPLAAIAATVALAAVGVLLAVPKR